MLRTMMSVLMCAVVFISGCSEKKPAGPPDSSTTSGADAPASQANGDKPASENSSPPQ